MRRFFQISAILLLQQALTASSVMAMWFETDRDTCSEIESKGLEAVLKSSKTVSGKSSAAEWMKAFDVATRAGKDDLAIAAMQGLAKSKPAPERNDLSQMCDFLIDRKLWSLATKFLETFPRSEPGWGYLLVRHMIETQNYSQTDEWLRSHQSANLHFWISLRLEAARKANKVQAFLSELESTFKKTPSLENLRSYMMALSQSENKTEPLWIFQSYKPAIAFDCWQAAEIIGTKHAEVCSQYLERALSLPYTAKDQALMEKYSRTFSARFFEKDYSFEKDLHTTIKSSLAKCYQSLGQSIKAQKLLLELSNENKGQMPIFAMSQLAGQIQSSTPTTPLENKIVKAEPANEKDPNYWLGRAKYYSGRKDDNKAVAALDKAMELSKLPAKDVSDTQFMIRMMVLGDYAYYLRNRNKSDQALRLYWNEYEHAKTAQQRSQLINSIWNLDSKAIKYNDARLWSHLKELNDWEGRQEQILMVQSENCPQEERNKFWTDLEAMAHDNPKRSLVLAWVMTRRNEPKRAIPLLQFCKNKFKDGEYYQRAAFTEMEAEMDLSNWKAAEKLYPAAKKQLQPSELPYWITRICQIAARTGAFDDAFRLWKQKDNIDRNYLDPLEELGKFPQLKSKLKKYYEDQAKNEPQSNSISKKALAILH